MLMHLTFIDSRCNVRRALDVAHGTIPTSVCPFVCSHGLAPPQILIYSERICIASWLQHSPPATQRGSWELLPVSDVAVAVWPTPPDDYLVSSRMRATGWPLTPKSRNRCLPPQRTVVFMGCLSSCLRCCCPCCCPCLSSCFPQWFPPNDEGLPSRRPLGSGN